MALIVLRLGVMVTVPMFLQVKLVWAVGLLLYVDLITADPSASQEVSPFSSVLLIGIEALSDSQDTSFVFVSLKPLAYVKIPSNCCFAPT